MINVMIRNVKGNYTEYSYINADGGEETSDKAIAYALELYIENVLNNFNSTVFPITEDLWNSAIKKAVETVEDISIQNKIDILNSICRVNALKISKVYTSYSVQYPPTMLDSPTAKVNTDYSVSWDAVANASGYKYIIGNGTETSHSDLSNLSISKDSIDSNTEVIFIKAVGNGKEYLDSYYTEINYKAELEELEEPDEPEEPDESEEE